MAIFTEDVDIRGALNVHSLKIADTDLDAFPRSKLQQQTLVAHPINLTDFRVHDAMQTNLPGTSSADDLGLTSGTFGTSSPTLRSSDLKAAGATTIRARCLVALPAEYDAGETVQIRVRGGMVTTVADTSATVDVEAHKLDEDGAVGSDLCTTSATTINSLTKGNKDFTITATTLNPGDRLDVRISVAVNDAATGTAVIAELSRIALLLDIKG